MSFRIEQLGNLLIESITPSTNPDPDRRIKVKLNVQGVEKRTLKNEIEGATKQFKRKARQFIYGKQNFHKGAFGIIPSELDGYESSSDIPSFDVREDCYVEWIYYFFKIGNRYLQLEKIARGVGSKRIHPVQLSDIEIPLPTLDEQKRLLHIFKQLELTNTELQDAYTFQLKLISTLRNQILQDAIKGKLVPQDPKDEPASVLLEKIKIEKEKLINEGKLKKQPLLFPVKTEEIPFDIPENWIWCRFGEVVVMSRGKFSIRPRNNPIYFGGNYPFIQIGSLDENGSTINDAPQSLNEKGYRVSKEFPVNTIAIAIVGGTIGNLGVLGTAMCFTDSMIGILPSDKYNQNYILNFLRYVQPKIKKAAYQMAGQPNIKIPTLTELVFPLPPLKEQERIVSKIDELLSLHNELENNIKLNQKLSQQLLQSTLKEALEPKDN